MKFCPFCGSGLQDDMIFCPHCGKKFQDIVKNTEESEPAKIVPVSDNAGKSAEAPTVMTITAESEDTPIEMRPQQKAKALVVIVLICAILAIAAGVIFTTSKEKPIDIAEIANSVLYLEVYDDANNITSTASGFVIDDGTTLITNYHVIEDAYHIVAWTPDGEVSVEVSNILTYDKLADIAVLKCDSNIGVTPLTLGNSDLVEQGDTIYAVGYPLGLAHTLSDGVISSRYVDENDVDMLQITAAISPGSSGGALLDDKGTVVGIICASYVDGQNLNLAVPVSTLISLRQTSNTEKCISLNSFYKQTLHAKELHDVLANKSQYLEKDVVVKGYVSSMDLPNHGEIIGLSIVCSPEEVIGQITHGYPFQSEAEIITHEYIWDLLSNQQALEVYIGSAEKGFSDFTKVAPGDYVTIKGTLHETENTEALHDYTAYTLYLSQVELLGFN